MSFNSPVSVDERNTRRSSRFHCQGPAGPLSRRRRRRSRIRVGGLRLFWSDRRRFDRGLRIGWQDLRAGSVDGSSRRGMLRLFGRLDFWRIPSIADLKTQHDKAMAIVIAASGVRLICGRSCKSHFPADYEYNSGNSVKFRQLAESGGSVYAIYDSIYGRGENERERPQRAPVKPDASRSPQCAAQEHFASMQVERDDKPAEMARHPSTGVGLFLYGPARPFAPCSDEDHQVDHSEAQPNSRTRRGGEAGQD
jgi:hypothetical protein